MLSTKRFEREGWIGQNGSRDGRRQQ